MYPNKSIYKMHDTLPPLNLRVQRTNSSSIYPTNEEMHTHRHENEEKYEGEEQYEDMEDDTMSTTSASSNGQSTSSHKHKRVQQTRWTPEMFDLMTSARKRGMTWAQVAQELHEQFPSEKPHSRANCLTAYKRISESRRKAALASGSISDTESMDFVDTTIQKRHNNWTDEIFELMDTLRNQSMSWAAIAREVNAAFPSSKKPRTDKECCASHHNMKQQRELVTNNGQVTHVKVNRARNKWSPELFEHMVALRKTGATWMDVAKELNERFPADKPRTGMDCCSYYTRKAEDGARERGKLVSDGYRDDRDSDSDFTEAGSQNKWRPVFFDFINSLRMQGYTWVDVAKALNAKWPTRKPRKASACANYYARVKNERQKGDKAAGQSKRKWTTEQLDYIDKLRQQSCTWPEVAELMNERYPDEKPAVSSACFTAYSRAKQPLGLTNDDMEEDSTSDNNAMEVDSGMYVNTTPTTPRVYPGGIHQKSNHSPNKPQTFTNLRMSQLNQLPLPQKLDANAWNNEVIDFITILREQNMSWSMVAKEVNAAFPVKIPRSDVDCLHNYRRIMQKEETEQRNTNYGNEQSKSKERQEARMKGAADAFPPTSHLRSGNSVESSPTIYRLPSVQSAVIKVGRSSTQQQVEALPAMFPRTSSPGSLSASPSPSTYAFPRLHFWAPEEEACLMETFDSDRSRHEKHREFLSLMRTRTGNKFYTRTLSACMKRWNDMQVALTTSDANNQYKSPHHNDKSLGQTERSVVMKRKVGYLLNQELNVSDRSLRHDRKRQQQQHHSLSVSQVSFNHQNKKPSHGKFSSSESYISSSNNRD